MAKASDVLALARAEIETKEYPPGSNNVKYNTAYYDQEVSGAQFSWCAVFIWWLFREAGISGLYYGGQKTAYVPTLMSWAKQNGLLVDTLQPGDLVCFDFNNNGVSDHIGICESFDGTYVTTIDGNTGTTSEANGGCVMRRRRHKKYILGVIRPAYESEGRQLTEEDVKALVRQELKDYMAELNAAEPTADWQKIGAERAKALGISDGSRPMGICTRVEAMIMAADAAEK